MAAKKARPGPAPKGGRGPKQPPAPPSKEASEKSAANDEVVAEPEETPPIEERRAAFPVVGIGASAGGLEALTELLRHLPVDLGIAYVFVQHLDPHRKSSLVEILTRSTKLKVVEIADGMQVEPGRLYVIPPDRDVAILHGVLHLMTRLSTHQPHMPVDYLFRSLSQEFGNCAIGVVLSGTGSDGTAGLRAIKAEGGITFAQKPETAKYSGMPESAAAATAVDFQLAPAEIALELTRIARHPYIAPRHPSGSQQSLFDSPEALQKVFVLLRKASGVDFSHYKQTTVERRLSRRMALHKIESMRHYQRFLEQNPAEVMELFEDMLINVTSFFREPDAFEALKVRVFPRLFEDRQSDAPIRVWVPACSTGEEAYSIAIALVEYMIQADVTRQIQVFATDVSEAAVERARLGRYLDEIAESVSPERLRRFFVKSGVGYQVAKSIRDTCIFAKQNLTRDPPFSNLDLLSCRNLLIYMGSVFQKRIIPTFHYALKPTGYLLLGQSETIGSFADLFTLVDRVHKIYAKKPTMVRMPLEFGMGDFRPKTEIPGKPGGQRPGGSLDLQQAADRVVMNRYAPPGVLINSAMDILHFRGQTGPYLEPAPGAATLNLLKMAREGLAIDLRALVHKAGKKKEAVRKEGLQCRANGGMRDLNLEVIPVEPSDADETYFLVLFEEVHPPARSKAVPAAASGAANKEVEKEVRRLRDELAQTKETLQHIIEEHETTNEELRAANEEIQSANEELQSTNEELETAKEELQSTNEELTTLNVELESQNRELNQVLDDFNNLHNSVNIPVVLVGADLRIRTFTPPAERSLKLIPADSGRSISELKLGIDLPDLEQKVLAVIETLNTHEEEVCDLDGHWYLARIRPYRTGDNKITGAVLALIDINDRKRAEHELCDAKLFAENVVAAIRTPLVVLDAQLRVQTANRAFYRSFQAIPAETEGQLLYQLGGGQWNVPRLRELLEQVIPQNAQVDDFVVEDEFGSIGRRRLVLNARRIEQSGKRGFLILLAMEDDADGHASAS